MAASRNRRARTGNRSIEQLPLRSYRAAVRALCGVIVRAHRTAFGAPTDRRRLRLSELTVADGFAGRLAIQSRRYESGLHFIVSGALDSLTAHRLRRQCERIDPDEAETVLLDLADLATIDSSGLDVLLAAYAHFGERLVIIISPPSAQTIELAEVRELLPIIEG